MADESMTSFEPGAEEKDSSHLAVQTLEGLDVSTLTPLSPQVISRQATINIGMPHHQHRSLALSLALAFY